MIDWRYTISLLMFKSCKHIEDKFHIPMQPCVILYLINVGRKLDMENIRSDLFHNTIMYSLTLK